MVAGLACWGTSTGRLHLGQRLFAPAFSAGAQAKRAGGAREADHWRCRRPTAWRWGRNANRDGGEEGHAKDRLLGRRRRQGRYLEPLAAPGAGGLPPGPVVRGLENITTGGARKADHRGHSSSRAARPAPAGVAGRRADAGGWPARPTGDHSSTSSAIAWASRGRRAVGRGVAIMPPAGPGMEGIGKQRGRGVLFLLFCLYFQLFLSPIYIVARRESPASPTDPRRGRGVSGRREGRPHGQDRAHAPSGPWRLARPGKPRPGQRVQRADLATLRLKGMG
jgi:hypothetical protein